MSVLINAFVLAFTSQLIPSLVYRHTASPDNSMHGYLNWTLAYFNVRDFANESRPLNSTDGGIPLQERCRYPGYRDPFYPYERNMKYWMILSARLAFVLCFVIFVLFVSWMIAWMISDVPKTLELTIKREKFLANEADKVHQVKVEQQRVTVPSTGSLRVVPTVEPSIAEDENDESVADLVSCVNNDFE